MHKTSKMVLLAALTSIAFGLTLLYVGHVHVPPHNDAEMYDVTALAVILALLIFQSVFARNPFQRKTAFNYWSNAFPYWEAMDYLKTAGSRLRVYAPMEVEPSHFYLAKAGLAGKITWERTLPADFNAEKAAVAFSEGNYDFLLLPYSPFSGVKTDFRPIAGSLIAAKGFSAGKIYDYHGNKLILLTRTLDPRRDK